MKAGLTDVKAGLRDVKAGLERLKSKDPGAFSRPVLRKIAPLERHSSSKKRNCLT